MAFPSQGRHEIIAPSRLLGRGYFYWRLPDLSIWPRVTAYLPDSVTTCRKRQGMNVGKTYAFHTESCRLLKNGLNPVFILSNYIK